MDFGVVSRVHKNTARHTVKYVVMYIPLAQTVVHIYTAGDFAYAFVKRLHMVQIVVRNIDAPLIKVSSGINRTGVMHLFARIKNLVVLNLVQCPATRNNVGAGIVHCTVFHSNPDPGDRNRRCITYDFRPDSAEITIFNQISRFFKVFFAPALKCNCRITYIFKYRISYNYIVGIRSFLILPVQIRKIPYCHSPDVFKDASVKGYIRT